MTGILYDCLVYEPDVTVALSPTDVVRPKRSPLLLSLWLLFWSPWAWLRRWGGKRPAEDERPSAALQDFQLAASRGHEAVAVLQRQPTGCTLRLRFAASAYLTVHEEELPGPVGTGGGGGGAVALAEDGRYCAVWNGQLWVFRLSGGAGSSAVENDEAPTEEEVTVQLLQTRPLPSRSSLASPAPLQLATAEGGRAIVGLAKSLLAPLGVRHLEFYRPPADAPDGDPDLPPPLLLLLPEDGLYVCAVPCGGGGGEEGAAVDRAFDATGPRSLLVSAADASSARHITAFACHAGTHTVALTCHTAAPTVQGGTILSMAFSPEGGRLLAVDSQGRAYVYGVHRPSATSRAADGAVRSRRPGAAVPTPIPGAGDDEDVFQFPAVPGLFPGNEGASLQALVAFTPAVVLRQPRSAVLQLGVGRREGPGVTGAQWWAEDAVILVQGPGYVTVNAVADGRNLLGPTAEKFRGPCLATAAHADPTAAAQPRKFFVWECERHGSRGGGPASCSGRLLCFRETPPQQLLRLKVQQGKFDDALKLAALYSLNPDVVYKTRWLMTPVQSESIRRFLEPVSDVRWQLEQCCRAVAPTGHLQQALLQYGLRLCETQADADAEDEADGSAEATAGPVEGGGEWWALRSVWRLPLPAYRLVLELQAGRFQTFGALTREAYSPAAWLAFRDGRLLDYALDLAHKGDLPRLKQLARLHPQEVLPHLYAVLSRLPHTTPPAEYADLLPGPEEGPAGADRVYRFRPERRRRDVDWARYSPAVVAAMRHVLPGLGPTLPWTTADVDAQYRLRPAGLAAWVRGRGADIDAACGRLDLALELVELGLARELPGLADTLRDLQGCSAIVYGAGEADLTLCRYRQLTDEERVRLLLKDVTGATYRDVLLTRAAPFLIHLEDGVRGPVLAAWMRALARRDLPLCHRILADCVVEPQPLAPLLPSPGVVRTIAIACVHEAQGPEGTQTALRILHLLPLLPECASAEEEAEKAEADQLARWFHALALLQRYGLDPGWQQVRDMEGSPSKCMACLKRLTMKDSRASNKRFRALLGDLFRLRRTVLSSLSGEELLLTFCQTLISMERFDLCQDYLFHPASCWPDVPPPGVGPPGNAKAAEAPAGEGAAARQYLHKISSLTVKTLAHTIAGAPADREGVFGLSAAASAQLVVDAARHFLNAAMSVHDEALQLAARCLALADHADPTLPVAEPGASGSSGSTKPAAQSLQEAVAGECRLLECCAALAQRFSFGMLPIQLRDTGAAAAVLDDVFARNADAYTAVEALTRIADLLPPTPSAAAGAPVLLRAAEAAFAAGDFAICFEYCQQLIQQRPPGAADLCLRLHAAPGFDHPDKARLLGYALAYGEARLLPAMLERGPTPGGPRERRSHAAPRGQDPDDGEDVDFLVAKWQHLVQDMLASLDVPAGEGEVAEALDGDGESAVAAETAPLMEDEAEDQPQPLLADDGRNPSGGRPVSDCLDPDSPTATVSAPPGRETPDNNAPADGPGAPAEVWASEDLRAVLSHPANAFPDLASSWAAVLQRLSPQRDRRGRPVDLRYAEVVVSVASLATQGRAHLPLACRCAAEGLGLGGRSEAGAEEGCSDARLTCEVLEAFGLWLSSVEAQFVSETELRCYHASYDLTWHAFHLVEQFVEETEAEAEAEPEPAAPAAVDGVSEAAEGGLPAEAVPDGGAAGGVPGAGDGGGPLTKAELQRRVAERPGNPFLPAADAWEAVLARMDRPRDAEGRPIDSAHVRGVLGAASLALGRAEDVRLACRYVAVWGFGLPALVQDFQNDVCITGLLLTAFGKWLGTAEAHFAAEAERAAYHSAYDTVWKAVGVLDQYGAPTDSDSEASGDGAPGDAAESGGSGSGEAVEAEGAPDEAAGPEEAGEAPKPAESEPEGREEAPEEAESEAVPSVGPAPDSAAPLQPGAAAVGGPPHTSPGTFAAPPPARPAAVASGAAENPDPVAETEPASGPPAVEVPLASEPTSSSSGPSGAPLSPGHIPKTRPGLMRAVVERSGNPFHPNASTWQGLLDRLGAQQDTERRAVDAPYLRLALGVAGLVVEDRRHAPTAGRCAAVCVFGAPLAVRDVSNDVYLTGRLLAGFEGWLRAVAVHLSSEEERACHAAAAELVAGAVAVLADFDDEDDEEEGEGEG